MSQHWRGFQVKFFNDVCTSLHSCTNKVGGSERAPIVLPIVIRSTSRSGPVLQRSRSRSRHTVEIFRSYRSAAPRSSSSSPHFSVSNADVIQFRFLISSSHRSKFLKSFHRTFAIRSFVSVLRQFFLSFDKSDNLSPSSMRA